MDSIKYNIISVDHHIDESVSFRETLEKESGMMWTSFSLVSNYKKKDKLTELKRYLKYVQAGWNLFWNRQHYKNIIAWQQFHGVFYAFFCRLFHVKKVNSLILMMLIYKPKKGLSGRIYKWFVKYSIHNEYVDQIVCFSEEEIKKYCNLFGLVPDKFTYMKVASAPVKDIEYHYEEPKYIFTAGFSHRDFKFVIDSLRGTSYRLVIADDRVEDPHLPNVRIERECYGGDMLRLMGRCYVFINPLKDRTISVGQLMAISAMQLHKPTICTASEGMKPYLVDGVTGYFIDKSREELLEKLDILYSDSSLYSRMCEEAYKYGEDQFSWGRLAKDVVRMGKEKKLFK